MQNLAYVNGYCVAVDTQATVADFHKSIVIAQRVVICSVSSVFCVHLSDNVVLYFSGMNERVVNGFYTSLLAPYSEVGKTDDKDLFVDSVQIVLDNFSSRLAQFLGK